MSLFRFPIRIYLLIAILLMLPLRSIWANDQAEYAPPLQLKDIHGKIHELTDYHGKLVVLNFWATWCPPCLFEMPLLQKYQQQYAAQGLQVIGVTNDHRQAVIDTANTLNIDYPLLLANDPELLPLWGNEQQLLPYTVIIGRAGLILDQHRGMIDKYTFQYQILPLLD